jgi:simple sugar transport system permease protein
MGGTLLAGGAEFGGGTLIGILIQGLIQTCATFDGMFSSGWTKA